MAGNKLTFKRDDLSKLLRYVLGVAPDEFGLYPNTSGYVTMKNLVAALRSEDGWRGTTENRIMELINHPDTDLELEGTLIRLKPDLAQLPPEIPPGLIRPKLLYIGLKPTAWPPISQNGLRPRPQEEVIILFPTPERAKAIARRFIPEPVTITVQTSRAESTGTIFRPYSEQLWLADQIQPEALSGPPITQEQEHVPSKRQPQIGLMVAEPVVDRGKKKGKYNDSPQWKTQIRRERRRGQQED